MRGWLRGGWRDGQWDWWKGKWRDGQNETTLRNHMTWTWCLIFRWTMLLNWLSIMEKSVMLQLTGMAWGSPFRQLMHNDNFIAFLWWALGDKLTKRAIDHDATTYAWRRFSYSCKCFTLICTHGPSRLPNLPRIALHSMLNIFHCTTSTFQKGGHDGSSWFDDNSSCLACVALSSFWSKAWSRTHTKMFYLMPRESIARRCEVLCSV